MKRNKWLLILLLVLVGATIYFVMSKRGTTLNEESKNFAVKDTASITRIFLANRNGNTIRLDKKEDGKWLLNLKEKPRQDLLSLLLDCIHKVEVRTPVAKAAYNNVVKTLASSAIKCEIYLNNESKPSKTYYIGGQTEDEMGTFMMIENSSLPFITYIPGFNGYLTPRYSVNLKDWQSTELFVYQPNEIKFIMVNYTASPENSFLLSMDRGRYLVQNTGNSQFIQRVDSVAVDNYIAQYKNIFYEVPVDPRQRDTLNMEPQAIFISVKGMDDKLKSVSIFPMPLSRRSLAQTDSTGKVLKYDRDRVYAMIGPENKLVIMQQTILNRLLRQFSDFDANRPKDRKNR